MKKLKIALAVSLLFNVGEICGFLAFKKYVTSTTFRLVAETTEAEVSLLRNILSDLDSGDPEKITALRKRLEFYIENGDRAASTWRHASNK